VVFLGFFFSDDNKYVSKEDGVKYKEEKYNGAAKYQRIEERGDSHDNYFAYRTADGAYTEGYHGENVSNEDKRDLGRSFDNSVNNGPHCSR